MGKESKKKNGKEGAKAKYVSRSSKAGLHFPVGRIHRYLKQLSTKKVVGGKPAIFCTAILEYIAAEVLELAGNACKDLGAKRITPRHLYLAIRGDDELDLLIKGTIAGSGVIPHIHNFLKKKKNETSSTSSTGPSIPRCI